MSYLGNIEDAGTLVNLQPLTIPVSQLALGGIVNDVKDLIYGDYIDITNFVMDTTQGIGTVLFEIPYDPTKWGPLIAAYAAYHERYTGSISVRFHVNGQPVFVGETIQVWVPDVTVSTTIPQSQIYPYFTMPMNTTWTEHIQLGDNRQYSNYRVMPTSASYVEGLEPMPAIRTMVYTKLANPYNLDTSSVSCSVAIKLNPDFKFAHVTIPASISTEATTTSFYSLRSLVGRSLTELFGEQVSVVTDGASIITQWYDRFLAVSGAGYDGFFDWQNQFVSGTDPLITPPLTPAGSVPVQQNPGAGWRGFARKQPTIDGYLDCDTQDLGQWTVDSDYIIEYLPRRWQWSGNSIPKAESSILRQCFDVETKAIFFRFNLDMNNFDDASAFCDDTDGLYQASSIVNAVTSLAPSSWSNNIKALVFPRASRFVPSVQSSLLLRSIMPTRGEILAVRRLDKILNGTDERISFSIVNQVTQQTVFTFGYGTAVGFFINIDQPYSLLQGNSDSLVVGDVELIPATATVPVTSNVNWLTRLETGGTKVAPPTMSRAIGQGNLAMIAWGAAGGAANAAMSKNQRDWQTEQNELNRDLVRSTQMSNQQFTQAQAWRNAMMKGMGHHQEYHLSQKAAANQQYRQGYTTDSAAYQTSTLMSTPEGDASIHSTSQRVPQTSTNSSQTGTEMERSTQTAPQPFPRGMGSNASPSTTSTGSGPSPGSSSLSSIPEEVSNPIAAAPTPDGFGSSRATSELLPEPTGSVVGRAPRSQVGDISNSAPRNAPRNFSGPPRGAPKRATMKSSRGYAELSEVPLMVV